MANNPLKKVSEDSEPTSRYGYWQNEIDKATKRYSTFVTDGARVVDKYRMEREGAQETLHIWQDRYNILYSSTETTRPSLYATTPKVQATKRHPDRENENVTLATLLLEVSTQYAMEEIDFDEVMNNVIEDYLLPGLGVAWVRYVPTIQNRTRDDGTEYEKVAFEGLDIDYVHYKDFLTGPGRIWKELPWVGRRVYFTRQRALKRFGKEKANKLRYTFRPDDDRGSSRDSVGFGGEQSVVYEIWDRENEEVIWFSTDYTGDILDSVKDPLKVKGFFPCPRPLRAVSNTKTFIPKAFYSQYKGQAEELDNITARIRHLTKALRVIGVFDASQENLAQLLSGTDNKMVPVQNWAAFAQNGGMNGSVQMVPIKDIAVVLTELYRQRDIAKNEIYEITGFSDIVRGVSKASETLGAQQIKSDWATGRLRILQKEVQRFCRDLIRIMAEIIAEQFSEDSLATYAGFEPPPVSPEEKQVAQQYAASQLMGHNGGPPLEPPPPTMRQQAIQKFLEVVELLKNEKLRCANICIETDSTIMPDEAKEREDRMAFLSSAGAFLQQAGPMALQYPDMRGLLGAIMMFTIRTFRASRPLEKEFSDFTKKLAAAPPMNPNGEQGQGDNGEAAANAQMQSEQIKAQVAQQKMQQEDATKRYEIDAKLALEREKMQMEMQIRTRELEIREREVAVKEAQARVQAEQAQNDAALASREQEVAEGQAAADMALEDRQQAHNEDMDHDAAERADRDQELGQANADARDAAREAAKSKSKDA